MSRTHRQAEVFHKPCQDHRARSVRFRSELVIAGQKANAEDKGVFLCCFYHHAFEASAILVVMNIALFFTGR